MTDARKPLIFKAFRASLTLVPAGYITPRDTERFCDLPLRAGHPAAETVARGDDLLLALSQTLAHELPHKQAVVTVLDVEVHRILHADDIEKRERLAVAIGIERIVERDLALQFLAAAKIHKDLIRYPLLTDS